MTPRRFHGTGKTPVHYDRKVLRYGYSAMISMGHIIPKDWEYARVTVLEQNPKEIIVKLALLRLVNNHAPDKNTGEKSEQNTQRIRAPSRSKHRRG